MIDVDQVYALSWASQVKGEARAELGEPALLSGLPLVSIIIISYNDHAHISEAVDSALGQTYSNCEVIVVDDGSTDGTGELISRRYGNRVQYYWKENGGMGSARNHGIYRAQGKYIQNLDSDDLLLPEKVAHQVTYLEAHPEIAFVYSSILCFFDGEPSRTWEHPSNAQAYSGSMIHELLSYRRFFMIMPLLRRSWIERIGGFDSLLNDAHDYDFMLRLAYAGASGYFLDLPLYLYRHYRSPSNTALVTARHAGCGQLKGEVYLLTKLCALMEKDAHPYLHLATVRLSETSFQLGWILFGQGERKWSIHHLRHAIRHSRERWAYKMFILIVAAVTPGRQLRDLRRYFRSIVTKRQSMV